MSKPINGYSSGKWLRKSRPCPCVHIVMGDTFCGGISLFAMARKTKKRKYRATAKKVHALVKLWASKGNPNVNHHGSFLNAEAAALEWDVDGAEGWYQSAILLALDGGLIQDAALANERYVEFLLYYRKETKKATFKLEEAMRLYGEWGAAKKVELLREQYKHLWQQLTEIIVTVSATDDIIM